MKHYRQGDVLIERVAEIPAEAVKQPKGQILLAHGEVTGHHHSVAETDSADWWKLGDDQFIEAKKPATVVHQEHAPIQLPKGRYRVRRQREYSPEAIRSVAD